MLSKKHLVMSLKRWNNMHTEINFIFRFSVYKFYLISPTPNNWICALMHVNAVVRKRGKTGKYSDPPFFPVFKNLTCPFYWSFLNQKLIYKLQEDWLTEKRKSLSGRKLRNDIFLHHFFRERDFFSKNIIEECEKKKGNNG